MREDFRKIGQEIGAELFSKWHFTPPITWTLVGGNGEIFAGRWEFSISGGLRSVTLTGDIEKLEFPVNIMLIDRTGKAAHLLFRIPDGPVSLMSLQTGHA
jgi:hypothetical protein